MAINLLSASHAHVDFADTVTGTHTVWTMMVTITIGGSLAGGNRLGGEWGGGVGNIDQAFLMARPSGGEIGFVVHGGAGYFGRQTTDTPLAINGTYRIVATWTTGTPNVITIWVNGATRTTTSWTGSANVASLSASNQNTFVGRDTVSGADGTDGDYSEFALYNEVVPDWVAQSYGAGMSPQFYRSNGVLYVPLLNTSNLVDLWRGSAGTNTSGTNASHPDIYRPSDAA